LTAKNNDRQDSGQNTLGQIEAKLTLTEQYCITICHGQQQGQKHLTVADLYAGDEAKSLNAN
jgi:hypothetical protein